MEISGKKTESIQGLSASETLSILSIGLFYTNPQRSLFLDSQ